MVMTMMTKMMRKMTTMMTTMMIITRHAHWQDVHCRYHSLAAAAAGSPMELRLQSGESTGVHQNEYDNYKDDDDYHRHHDFLPRVNLMIQTMLTVMNVMFVIVIIIMTQILIMIMRLKN